MICFPLAALVLEMTGQERELTDKYEIIINSRTECEEGVVYLQLFVESVQASHGIDLLRFP